MGSNSRWGWGASFHTTPKSRTNLRKKCLFFQQIPTCTLVLPSEAYHSWIFGFFWYNSTGSSRIYPVLSQKAKLISRSNILGSAPDEQLVELHKTRRKKLSSALIVALSFAWFSQIICTHIPSSSKQWVGFLIGFLGNHICIFYRR